MKARNTILILLFLGLIILSIVPQAHADLPVVTTNGDASRTINWSLGSPAGLDFENASAIGGHGSLAWRPQSLSWTRGRDFVQSNGTADANITVADSGLFLSANTSNRLADGNFTTAAPWAYVNGTSDNVTAEWDAGGHDSEMSYAAKSGLREWDGFNSTANLTANWLAAGSSGHSAAQFEVTSNPAPKEGIGLVGLDVTLWSGAGSVYLQRLAPVDWSRVNRLVLWFRMNTSLSVTFNISARIGATGPTRYTPAQSLTGGWQQIVVDLTGLGNATERASLQNLRLQVAGPSVPIGTWFYFDDLRVGNARIFLEAAHVTQTFSKTHGSSPRPGSAYVAFNWALENATGVYQYAPLVSIGAWQATFGGGVGAWHAYTADVSPYAAASGSYTIGFHLQVSANDTLDSNVTLRIDNASFVYPDRHNGSYASGNLTFGTDSQCLSLDWSASEASSTSVAVSIRSGNASGGGLIHWSPWQDTVAPGTYSVSVPGAHYFQIRATLGTDNASLTPVLSSLTLSAESRSGSGTVTSGLVDASADFLRWRSFQASYQAPTGTSLTFFVGNGSYWTLASASNIATFEGKTIRWKANFTTVDGLVTPLLFYVRITYEFQGPPVTVSITPTGLQQVTLGDYLTFRAVATDSGGHRLASAGISWSTDDVTGMIWSNGTYLAGSAGLHHVTATVNGTRVNTTVGVLVVSAGSIWTLGQMGPVILIIALAAAGGYAVYEVTIRRRFAIDDVFLIAKDGRMILHNTRRMRADRDEDILSGMLTAIMAFLRDQDPEENGELKRFEVGGKTTLLERGEHVYLTAIYSGRIPRWAGKDLHRFMSDLEERFGDAFAHWSGSPEDLHGLKEFMGRFVSHMRYRGSPRSANGAS